MIKKKDFIEIEFTAKLADGSVFDTNIEETAKKIGIDKVAHPLKICVGEGMVLRGFDNALDGKELNKKYSVELKPEDAFGQRDPSMIKTVPISAFLEKDVNPYPGMMLNLDGMIVRISSVSGGRVLVDFNNPLSGKNIIYEFKILNKIEDLNEKLKVLTIFYLGIDKFEIRENKVIVSGAFLKKLFEIYSKRAKEIFNLDVEMKKSEKAEKNEKK